MPVFGVVFDQDFKEISTFTFWKGKVGSVIFIYYDRFKIEPQNAPQKVKGFFADLLKEHILREEVTAEANELAKK